VTALARLVSEFDPSRRDRTRVRGRGAAAPWRFTSAQGTVRVATLAEVEAEPVWGDCFAHSRKDHRYYEIVERSLSSGFDHRYFVLENAAGTVSAIQPFFLVRQDVLAGSSALVRAMAARLRQVVPRFLTIQTLMVGCAAGAGELPFGPQDRTRLAELLGTAALSYARSIGVGLVVLKDFSSDYRPAMRALERRGYVRAPSMPATRLDIRYRGFDEYVAHVLGKATRKDLRRKFRRLESAAPLTLEVVADASSYADELHALYRQVFDRSSLRFETLTKEYLGRLGRAMPDRVRFFVWRQHGRAVAFSLCMIEGDAIWDEYIGLDYAVALDLHLYFVTFRDIAAWAMEHGFRAYCSTALSYEPKLRLGSELLPLDLYVSHTMPLLRGVLRWTLPLLEPTRNDPILRRFPNFDALKGPPPL
jgi:predicted N-acyltransferase